MKPRTIRIATRQSPLALWQANYVRELLLMQWPMLTIELLPLITSGDRFLKDKLLSVGGKGLFVKELEEALLANKADLAVHSTKDMPAELPNGLTLAAICERHTPFDAFISKQFANLNSLPPQAIVGTSSLRRQSQLLAYRPDLQIKALRGNINTRLAKLDAGEYDAIILAAAGLERIGMRETITEILSEDIMLPTCGQGAICVESRTEDPEIQTIIANLNNPISALCIQAEREVNQQLGGNCHVPLAVFCTLTASKQLFLRAKILSLDGTKCLSDSRLGSMDQAQILAEQCTRSLLDQGAAELISTVIQ